MKPHQLANEALLRPVPLRRLLIVLLVTALAVPAHGAGFGIFQQGAKAMGMAGAFTAQADDPTALFHNVGGLAHQGERAFQLGATFVSIGSTDFQGVAPGFGAGTSSQSESQFVTPAHFYWVEPVGDRWVFGLAVNSPFGLTSEWAEADFSGRFVSRMASLSTYDVSANLGWQASPTLGVGFGVIARASDTELVRNLASFDPVISSIVDIAKVELESDLETAYGYQLGVSSHPNNSWSWGFSYRSKIEVDYSGDGRLRQIATSNPQLDALVAQSLPFGVPLPFTTVIEFPDMASLGLAIKPSLEWLIEADVNWTGWSSLTSIDIRFSQAPALNVTLLQAWNDVFNYRLGMSRTVARGNTWRFGVSFDETPQPLTTLGPILPDGDQSALTLGYGFGSGSAASVDLALMYLDVEERTTRVNVEGVNGTYSSSALLFASTVTW